MRSSFCLVAALLVVGAGFLACDSSEVQADCGKIIIIVPPKPCPPRVPRCEPLYVVPPTIPREYLVPRPPIKVDVTLQNIITNNNSNSAVGNLQQGMIPLPPVGGGGYGGDDELPPNIDGYEDGYPGDSGAVDFETGGMPRSGMYNVGSGGLGFEEPEQQAIVAWNGKTDNTGEEVLILTTNEKAVGGAGAALSILPLPGEPISISRSKATIFADAKAYLVQKWAAGLGTGGLGVFMTAKIGSHNIFVWKMDDISRFEEEVKAYVETTYKGKATALITPQILGVVKDYHQRGFRYFAFDITMLSKDLSTKEAIAYHFKSKAAYFPLVISQIGGVGDTFIDLIVMTPGKITSTSYEVATAENGFKANNPKGIEATLNGKGSVPFNNAELRSLDEKLSTLFKGGSDVQVRNIQISGVINGFGKDFICK